MEHSYMKKLFIAYLNSKLTECPVFYLRALPRMLLPQISLCLTSFKSLLRGVLLSEAHP